MIARVKALDLIGYYSGTSFISSHVRVSVSCSTREAKSHPLTRDALEDGSSHSTIPPVLSMDLAHGRNYRLKCCQASYLNVLTTSAHMWQHCLQVPLFVLSFYSNSYTVFYCLRGVILRKLDCVSAYWYNKNGFDKYFKYTV